MKRNSIVGTRVIATRKARKAYLFPRSRGWPIYGTITGLTRSPLSVQVRPDYRKTASEFHHSFWRECEE